MPNTTLRVFAGEHDRRDCPLWLNDPGDLPSGSLVLQPFEDGEPVPVQRVANRFLVILDELSRGEPRTFSLEAGEAPAEGARLVKGDEALEITVGGRPFTTYRYAANEVRPYFYPLLGPTGVAMTRNFPMLLDAPGESTDHPHHRSLYVAFGEVNGVDVWAEPPNPNTGRIVHQGWDDMFDGPAAAGFRERLQWVDGRGTPLLDERRRAIVYNTASARLLDLEMDLMPVRAAVLFGDTKEGGPLAVRVASAIEGKRGGLIQNACGGRREAETWGKRAPWVDYSGAIDGTTVGVAIMDHPTSYRHPTYWHVRDYGLFAANPFGISAFTNDPAQRGDVVLVPGQTLRFRYRVCLHLGDAVAGQIADRYHDFAHPPTSTWE
jgi:hypothetical protein